MNETLHFISWEICFNCILCFISHCPYSRMWSGISHKCKVHSISLPAVQHKADLAASATFVCRLFWSFTMDFKNLDIRFSGSIFFSLIFLNCDYACLQEMYHCLWRHLNLVCNISVRDSYYRKFSHIIPWFYIYIYIYEFLPMFYWNILLNLLRFFIIRYKSLSPNKKGWY
jgi:hypothetical protein